MKTLLIDNYDSFTYNLYQLLAEVNGEEPLVVRNDQVSWSALARLRFENIVISPGPGDPRKRADFGICGEVLCEASVPTLGVCLGHQGLGWISGASVVPAPEAIHGRPSRVFHDGSGVFAGLPQGFQAIRYHSLIVADPLPPNLERAAWTSDGLIMGLRHTERPLWGVQFHPESIATEYGRDLLANFRDLTRAFSLRRPSRSASTPVTPGILAPAAPIAVIGPPLRRRATRAFVRRVDTWYDPEAAFVGLFAREPYAFWLDSSMRAEGLSRFSYMGASAGHESFVLTYESAAQRLTMTQAGRATSQSGDLFTYLARECASRACDAPDLPGDFNGGFVGYLGYELKADCGAARAHRSPTPDAALIFADRFLAFDHDDHALYLVCLTEAGAPAQADAWFDAMDRRLRALLPLEAPTNGTDDRIVFRLGQSHDAYIVSIHECQRYLALGDSYEMCLTNRIMAETHADPLAVYRNLRHLNPAPYAAYLRIGSLAVLCSSPERFLRVDRARQVEARPIKGTSARGASPEEDRILREALRASEKERAENLMIVDLLRNDLGRVCQIGSVTVPALMEVETYQTVHQLVSTVRGALRPELSAIDCIRAAFPGGSMTGAPKLRTMRLLDELETEPRGVYSGALGFLGLNGTADLNIVIRTIVMQDGVASIGVGGAIVMQSDPEREFEETLVKGHAPMQALALTATGSLDEDRWQVIGR